MNINQNVWEAIKILMEESFWGKNSSYDSLKKNLNNEIDEFIQGYKNKDVANSIEEAADVMMIMFCILYKISGTYDKFFVDEIMKAIVEKLKRRYRHLYEDKLHLEESQEAEKWKSVKDFENIANYMLCDNKTCKYCGKIGGANIRIEGREFYCSGCDRQIKISKRTVLFYNKSKRKKYVQIVVDSILEYVKGNVKAPETLKIDNPQIFDYFCNDILNSKYDLKEYFISYICEKYKIQREEVLQYCQVALKNYNVPIDGLSWYFQEIQNGKYSIFQGMTNEEIKKMKNKLSNVTMDIEKKIEKVIEYKARSWNNQLVHKYLLNYKKGGIDRIIECMTIIHYKDEKIRDLTVEISNMYNCVVGCRFCASGALPETTCFLDAMDYVRQLNTCLNESGINPNEFENFYVSFAGIGEPSVVYKTVAEGMVMIRDLYPKVRFNIATFGFDMNCFSYWKNLNLPIRTLQIPFYSDKTEKLEYIVKNLPKSYDFKAIVDHAMDYKDKYQDCRVKINYIAMKDINDEDDDIEHMCNYLEPFKKKVDVKISYLNYTKPGDENNIVSPGSERLNEIKDYLDSKGFNSYIFGTDINTELGCGQLAQNHISTEDV